MRNENIGNRQETLLKSHETARDVEVTTHFAKEMARPWGRQPAQCTINGYCRSFLFEFPGANLLEPVDSRIVYSDDDFRAVIVSNLTDYFERQPAFSPHYAIDVSLRAGVNHAYAAALEQPAQRTDPKFPLFFVVEENRKIAPTALNRGECYTVDEKDLFEGGREGKRALIAVKTIDGSWPDFKAEMYFVNIVLAAVMLEQAWTDPIRELCHRYCFVSGEGQAVYLKIPKSWLHVSVTSDTKAADILEKSERIKVTVEAMKSESEPNILKLFNSIILENNEDDNYLRLSYMRLWQAVNDAKKYLGFSQLWNTNTAMDGMKTPKELKGYRNKIAHGNTDKIELQYLNDLQHTAMELLRRKYLQN